MAAMLGDDLNLRARRVKLLLMDCDGVLTDGRLYFSAAGEQMKVFHVRDGQGLVLWREAGFKSGIISGRGAEDIIKARAEELEVDLVHCSCADKVAALRGILEATGTSSEETAYIGDDVGDIQIMNEVGFPVAVADAVPEVLRNAAFVTSAAGGVGAVREVVELLLNAKVEPNKY